MKKIICPKCKKGININIVDWNQLKYPSNFNCPSCAQVIIIKASEIKYFKCANCNQKLSLNTIQYTSPSVVNLMCPICRTKHRVNI